MLRLIISILTIFFHPHTLQAEQFLISGSPSYPPLSWSQNSSANNLSGVGIDLANKLFQELGYSYVLKYVGPWKRVQVEAQKGKIDFLAGLRYLKEREAYLEYIGPPLFVDKAVIFFLKDSNIKSYPEAFSKKGAGLLGDADAIDFEKFRLGLNDVSSVKLYLVGNIENAFEMLKFKRVDFVIYGLNAGVAYAEKAGLKDFVHVSVPLPERGLYFAISKKSNLIKKKSEIERKYREMLKRTSIEELIVKNKEQWTRDISSDESKKARSH